MKKILNYSLIMILCTTLVGCGGIMEKKDPIVGKWKSKNETYTFNSNKTCTYQSTNEKRKCKYETNGKTLIIFFEGKPRLDTTYRIEKNKLYIRNTFEEEILYEKK